MEKFDFEMSMEKLQEVVNKLEKGDLTIDESVNAFKEGIELSRMCTKKLDDVEREITVLINGIDGDVKEEPFIQEGD